MGSIPEVMQLCRLCLMKDDVNNLIFEDEDNISQIFLKISACLPIKVARDDTLPKKICDSCSYKLELLYDFLHTVTTSEKQLITLLKQLEDDPLTKVISHLPLTRIANVAPIVMKQELPDLIDTHSVDDITPSEDLNITVETEDYVLQQQQSPYESVEFEFQQERFIDNNDMNIDDSTTDIGSGAIKRKRQNIALKRLPTDLDSDEYEEDEDNDFELPDSKIAKIEDDSEVEQTPFVHLTSTTSDNDQPGPSGLGKTVGDGSYLPEYLQPTVLIEESVITIKTEIEPEKNIFKSKTKRKQPKPTKITSDIDIKDDLIKKFQKVICFVCYICKTDQKYTEEELRLHFKKVHKGRRLRIRLNEEPLECDVCSKRYKSPKSLKEHMSRHNKQFNCEVCASHFKTLLNYTIHLRLHSQEDEFKCILCDFKTDSINDITSHINNIHTEEYKYRCEQCGKGFYVLSWYNEHANEHTGAKPFTCEFCKKTFSYSRYLTIHKQIAHKTECGVTPNVHECVICKKQYQHRNSLKLHMNMHTGNIEICDICGKSLSSREKLKFHMRTHTGYKPFSCSSCGKCFTKKPLLTEHQRVHTGEKPYCCQFCFKGFSQRSSMVIHMRGHTGEKPYVCNFCNKGFVARAMLNIHFRTCRGFIL